MTEILSTLFSHQDEKYGDFIAKLIPTIPRERFIGVRSPEYKKIVRELKDCPEIGSFLQTLPHYYFEENTLHSTFLCKIRDFDTCLAGVEAFLP